MRARPQRRGPDDTLLIGSPLPAGLSKTFPLDGALFDGWLAQSVQITADDMLSPWALDGKHRLLSDQLLQGEQSLLSLMMDHSMKSTWKTPHLGRKTRAKPRARGHKPAPSPAASGVAAAAVARANKAAERGGARGGAKARRAERSRSAKAQRQLHLHHQLHPQPRAPEGGGQDPPQPPISKMDSCHISEERDAPPPEPSCPITVPKAGAGGGAKAGGVTRSTLRLRLSRQGKSTRSKVGGQEAEREGAGLGAGPGKDSSALFDGETDGYFSDAEQSDSDTRAATAAARKLGLAQLHAGKEDVLRRSVMAS